MCDIKVGDIVKIINYSYAVRVNAYDSGISMGVSADKFKVISYASDSLCSRNTGVKVHDIFIQSTRTNEIFLHSAEFVRKVVNKCECCGQEIKE